MNLFAILFFLYYKYIYNNFFIMGIGDGDWAQSPIPQSPIPKSPFIFNNF